MISWDATTHPILKPGASIFEKVLRYITRPLLSSDLIGGIGFPSKLKSL